LPCWFDETERSNAAARYAESDTAPRGARDRDPDAPPATAAIAWWSSACFAGFQPRGLEAVQVRHLHVEQDHVGGWQNDCDDDQLDPGGAARAALLTTVAEHVIL